MQLKKAKSLALELGYTQIVIHGYNGDDGSQELTTWGKTMPDCINAAEGGNVIKKFLGFPKELSNSLPAKIRKSYLPQKNIEMAEQQLTGYIHAIQGYGLKDLISSMGLTKEEWLSIKMKGNLSFMKIDMVNEIDNYFNNKI